MTNAHRQRAPKPRELSEDPGADLVTSVCDRLGFSAEDAVLVQTGAEFVSPSGLVCRLKRDEIEPLGALRPELDLPLLLEDLESPQLAALLDLQTVLVSTMGWTISAGAEQGQLCLSTLLASTTAADVVDGLANGGVLALSVLQMLVADPADIAAVPDNSR